MTAERAVLLVKKVTYFGEFGSLNSSCISKSIISPHNEKILISHLPLIFPPPPLPRCPSCIPLIFYLNITYSENPLQGLMTRSPSLGMCNYPTYSCHGVFTNQSNFSLNLTRIQPPAGTSVTSQKHGLLTDVVITTWGRHFFWPSDERLWRPKLTYFARKQG